MSSKEYMRAYRVICLARDVDWQSVARKFWPRVSIGTAEDCWEWQGGLSQGYGRIWLGTKTEYAHRVAWQLVHGTIADHLCICHKCDTPKCCNPGHMILGTQADNMADARNKQRHAYGERNGHAILTPEQVLAIRAIYIHGKVGYKTIADQFGLHWMTVCNIIKRKNWAWL